MYGAGELQSVYGNPREQGGLPSFLVLFLTVLSYGATPSFCASRIQYPFLRLLATFFATTVSYSPFLHFCDIGDSAAAVTASRCVPRWFQMIPLSATRSGRMPRRATWEMAGPVSSATFIMVITEYSMGLTPRLLSSYTFES